MALKKCHYESYSISSYSPVKIKDVFPSSKSSVETIVAAGEIIILNVNNTSKHDLLYVSNQVHEIKPIDN